jgi:hypothetical protein
VAAILALVGAFCANVRAGETPTATPTLRYVNHLAVQTARGSEIRCTTAHRPPGSRVWRDWLSTRLIRPDGFVASSARVRPGESAELAVEADWDGLCAVEINPGSSLVYVRFASETPHAYRSSIDAPLTTVGAWGPLCFFVPKETAYFNIWIRASVTREGLHYTVRSPLGEVVRDEEGDFDARTKVQIAVPKGQDGAAWSIELSRPTQRGLYLDDVRLELGRHLPPFLTPKPEWAAAFAGNWQYDPDAPVASTRLPDTEPTVEPFHGAAGAEIERAYSRDTDDGWKTTLPLTYILDYGAEHLGNNDYLESVRSAPPALLHLGKDVPLNHGWGPIRALGGENQAHGSGEDIDRISPGEVGKRIAGLRRMVDRLHAAGVRWVTPYVCGMTLDGDPQRRTGFWDFYDHWDDYRSLGLCPRPTADPFDWLQRRADGSALQYYRYNYPDKYYPAFKTNHRFAACWHSDGWRTWLSEVVRFAARCGYDGVFVDNACSQRCQCPCCLTAFREYLKRHFTADEARRLFAADSFDDVAFPEKGATLLEAEMTRYWCETIRGQLATLKAIGSNELGREFVVFPNGGRPAYIQRALMDADFVMFEKSIGDYGTHPGLVLSPLFESVVVRAYNDNVFEHKFVQCLRRRVKPIILSRAGYPQRPPERILNANAARLGMAECGAFSGGGGFLLRPYFDVYHDALNEYRRFFETHPDLYAGLDSYAQLAVLACPEQDWQGNRTHMMAVRSLTDRLTEAHVLFDYVSEARLNKDVLQRSPAVVAADLRVVSETQLGELLRYANDGGHLVAIGDFATEDESLAKRLAGASRWAPLLTVASGSTEPCGRGRVTRCEEPDVVSAAIGANAAVLACGDEQGAAHVKVNAFRTLRGSPERIVVHLVNYNVPLGVNAVDPIPIDDIELNLPLPPGAHAKSATTHAPDEPDVQLPLESTDCRACLRLPRLGIYRVVEIELL